ncbi:alpha/beta-hydrolase family protein [Nocardia sp. CDC186]|uniref:Alpha/beta-hydrolase family protein n=1 Tax=Nocardia implantans TaxID=3108168 RepID=A0ABU6AYQ6_9NOCA|nr:MULTISPECIES: alpha/beta hydrolase [unclassified Nocardia]MBF6190516.1 alpha/beta hydrolase [Nocardia beijingensis]MEA3528426.1 alpha/beta-hydrolase family protein [Nocardia sp. CDC192]MEB3512422.1 alpha/beta-hydrolase family protein [Nocardia sp. CDC186]
MLETAGTMRKLRTRAVAATRRAEDVIDLNYVGLVVATVFFALSVTPSLLPRDWLFQGLISGINAAIGYGAGCLLEWLFRLWVRPRLKISPPPTWARYAIKSAVLLTAALCAALMLVQSARWQREITALMGMAGTTTPAYLRTGLLSLTVGAAAVAVYRTVREIILFLARLLNRWVRVPRELAPAAGFLVLVVLAVTIFNGVATQAFFAVANSAFSVRNDHTSVNAVQPQQPERSGSPASLAKWETLGFEGRWFVSHGPTASRITSVTGRPAKEPIRAYVGLESVEGDQEPAELAVSELERTGAFDRKALVVVTTTGTGWVNSLAAGAIEYMYDGDTAIVATQYSYLPSVLSFLADRNKATAAGRDLFDAVYGHWTARPPEVRPKLLVYGESLGSQGSEAAFDGLADLRAKVDGALWVGPPNSNRLWQQFVARRDPGSREVQPLYADGLVVRFASDSADLARPSSEWRPPRIAYLQHASDPIVWWSADLIFSRPDWLSEPRGSDVSSQMRWWPFVTFWQVAADLTNAQGVTDGHGHRYGSLVLDGWAAIAAPPDWTAERSERIRLEVEAAEEFERKTK